MTKEERIRPRDRDAILQSLSAGVVPRRGQHLIQVGRRDEIGAMVRDLERLEDGGSAVRFLIGQYGSGKTFFLHLTRSPGPESRIRDGACRPHADTEDSFDGRARARTLRRTCPQHGD